MRPWFFDTRFLVLITLFMSVGLSVYLESSIPFASVANGALLALINHKHQETKQRANEQG